MFPAPRTFSRAALADARHRYEETKESVASIAARLGIGERTLHTKIRKWNWRQRRPGRSSRTAGHAVGAPAAVALPVIDADAMGVAEHIQRTVLREIAAIGSIVASLPPRSANTSQAERTARVLATLTRTLQEVLRLTATEAAPDEQKNDRGPHDPDDFLRQLARRMDAFAAAVARPVPDDAEPGGG
jgi:transposase-like protein